MKNKQPQDERPITAPDQRFEDIIDTKRHLRRKCGQEPAMTWLHIEKTPKGHQLLLYFFKEATDSAQDYYNRCMLAIDHQRETVRER